jgi:hypothetical protein
MREDAESEYPPLGRRAKRMRAAVKGGKFGTDAGRRRENKQVELMIVFRTWVLRSLSVLAILALVVLYYADKYGVYYQRYQLSTDTPYMRSLYAQPVGTDFHALAKAAATLKFAGMQAEAKSLQAYYTDCALRLVASSRDPCHGKSVRSAIDMNLKQPVPPPPLPLPRELEPAIQGAFAVSLPQSNPDDAPKKSGSAPAEYTYKGDSIWVARGRPDTEMFRATVKNVGNLPIRGNFRLRLDLPSNRHAGLAKCPDVTSPAAVDEVLLPGKSVDVFCSMRIRLQTGGPLTDSGERFADLRPGGTAVDFIRFAQPDLIVFSDGSTGTRYSVIHPPESEAPYEAQRDIRQAGKLRGCSFIKSCPTVFETAQRVTSQLIRRGSGGLEGAIRELIYGGILFGVAVGGISKRPLSHALRLAAVGLAAGVVYVAYGVVRQPLLLAITPQWGMFFAICCVSFLLTVLVFHWIVRGGSLRVAAGSN